MNRVPTNVPSLVCCRPLVIVYVGMLKKIRDALLVWASDHEPLIACDA
jgi:hypothetical protein